MRATDKHAAEAHDLEADDNQAADNDHDAALAAPPAVAQTVHRVAAAMRRALADSPRLPDPAGLSRAHHQAMVDLYVANRGADEGDRDLSGGAQSKRLGRALETLAPVLADALLPEVPDGKRLRAELEAKIARLRAHIADRIAVEGVVFSTPKAADPDEDSDNDADANDTEKDSTTSETEAARS